ncbi:hypothetical protein LINPERPRIM_LOCUS27218 [Linum perenne]
MCITGCWCR